MTTLSVFRSRLKVFFKKNVIFLALATLPHEIRTFFCLASFSDHCACRPVLFFSTGQDTTRFPISIARIE